MVEHHVKYSEIHGIDETVWMTKSKHSKLHSRLREEGKCTIPTDELQKISRAAHARTPKAKQQRRDRLKNMKFVNETFMDDEFNEIETIKTATGLNWHDFLLDAARLYNR